MLTILGFGDELSPKEEGFSPVQRPVCGELLILPESAIRHAQPSLVLRAFISALPPATLHELRQTAGPQYSPVRQPIGYSHS